MTAAKTSTVTASSEPTTVETAAGVGNTSATTTKPSACHSRSGAEAGASRTGSAVDPVRIVPPGDVVSSRPPTVIVGTEVMVVRRVTITVAVAAIEQRRFIGEPGRIKPPTERAIEDSVAGNKCVGAEPRIPVPVCTPPTEAPRSPSRRGVEARGVHVCLSQIGRSQAAPAVEISFLVTFLVKLLRFQFAVVVQADLVTAFHRDVAPVFLDLCLAIKDTKLGLLQIKVVQTGFQQPRRGSLGRNLQIVLGVDLRHFYHRFALI